ncbi:DUF1028 domain-containing protein [Bacillus sp. T33-2]|uniref:DUF1028 domain-containing protein n=1 Tax=Bacillus sp. T33-2 TaxID=2054168 RepID=UPI000C76450A|nr:DUF1028 domain-containing protein [Bacillus sp. T33-2]PLR95876.1 fimbrial assembly protein FimA [Bacillus sp. T33-2]
MKLPRDCVNTFSIVAFDPETGELGVAVASKFLSVGSIVPWAKAGVGAIATQSWVNPVYGQRGLELMAEGKTAQETLEILTSEDVNPEVRQAGFVDAQGNSATFTGQECYSWAGGISGTNFACQGNILTSENVVQSMADTFKKAEGDLATRLTEALKAGEDAGGDSRGKQSAALLIVKENGGYAGVTDRYIDLRVDDHAQPVKELKRILYLHQLYFQKPKEEDILPVEGQLMDEIVSSLKKLDYLKTDAPSEAHVFEAVLSFHLIENFDERIQEKGFIDKKVVEFMSDLATQKD